jgi:hypothetical protein
MDIKKAKEILTASNLKEFSQGRLHDVSWYLHAVAGDERATLDGDFTADELEAIAAWMRNPKEVMNVG